MPLSVGTGGCSSTDALARRSTNPERTASVAAHARTSSSSSGAVRTEEAPDQLLRRADLVVDGPEGCLALLEALARD